MQSLQKCLEKHGSFCCFSDKLWYLQHNYVGDTIVYHKASDFVYIQRWSSFIVIKVCVHFIPTNNGSVTLLCLFFSMVYFVI